MDQAEPKVIEEIVENKQPEVIFDNYDSISHIDELRYLSNGERQLRVQL